MSCVTSEYDLSWIVKEFTFFLTPAYQACIKLTQIQIQGIEKSYKMQQTVRHILQERNKYWMTLRKLFGDVNPETFLTFHPSRDPWKHVLP